MPASDQNVQTERFVAKNTNLVLRIARVIYLTALASWISALYFSIIRQCFSHEAYMAAVKKMVFIDFSKFYTSGLLAWSLDRSKLYDFAEQMIWVRNVVGTLDRPADSIPYTPMFCVFMGVFTWLPIEKALLLALISISSVAFISVTTMLVQRGHLNKTECLMFWILALTPFGMTEIFLLGQSTFFWLAMMSTFYLFFLNKKDILSGIALALLALKPQYALLAIAVPIGCKRWKILLAAALAELTFIIIATCVLGVDTVLSYPKFLNWTASLSSTIIPNHNPTLGMITMRGLLAPFIPEILNYRIASAVNVLLAIPLFFVWRMSEKSGAEAVNWAIVLTVTCTIFFSAHSMIYDFLLVIIGWAVTLKTGDLSGNNSSNDHLKRVWINLFWFIPGFTWLLAGLHTSYEITARTHAILLFCIICIACARLQKLFKKQAIPAQT